MARNIIRECKLNDIEIVIEQIRNEVDLHTGSSIQIATDGYIQIEGIEVEIPELDITLAEGIYYQKNWTTNEYVQDWNLTIFKHINQSWSDYIYFEQDGILTSLHNLNIVLKALKFTGSELCKIYTYTEDKVEEKS